MISSEFFKSYFDFNECIRDLILSDESFQVFDKIYNKKFRVCVSRNQTSAISLRITSIFEYNTAKDLFTQCMYKQNKIKCIDIYYCEFAIGEGHTSSNKNQFINDFNSLVKSTILEKNYLKYQDLFNEILLDLI